MNIVQHYVDKISVTMPEYLGDLNIVSLQMLADVLLFTVTFVDVYIDVHVAEQLAGPEGKHSQSI